MATSAEQIVQRYQQAMASGVTAQRYKDGIDAVTQNPMEKAAAAAPYYLQRVQEAVSSGKYAEKLRQTPMARWKDGAKNKGAARLASGAAQAIDKVRAAAQKWAPIYNQVSETVQAMNKGGLVNAQARSAKAIEMMMSAAGRT